MFAIVVRDVSDLPSALPLAFAYDKMIYHLISSCSMLHKTFWRGQDSVLFCGGVAASLRGVLPVK